MLLIEKRSKSCPCSYRVFSLNSSFFHSSFLEANRS